MDNQSSIRVMLQLIIFSLTDNPQAVKIEVTGQDGGTTFSVTVHPGDIGKVIGKGGRTARSIRTILAAASMRDKTRYDLDITPNPESTPLDPVPSTGAPQNWIAIPPPPAPARGESTPRARR